MPRAKVKRIQVLVGTRKGAFVFTSDQRRRSWKVDGPHFAGQNVYHLSPTVVGTDLCKQGRGLPSRDAYVLVLREAFSTDEYDPAGLYFGTETGQLFCSSNEGSQWRLLANYLPPILSVETALV